VNDVRMAAAFQPVFFLEGCSPYRHQSVRVDDSPNSSGYRMTGRQGELPGSADELSQLAGD
jgi:hypothetical protein